MLLSCIYLCSSCESTGEIIQKTDDDIYLAGFDSVTLQSEITTVQPMTGIVFWPAQAKSRNSTYGNSISLEYSYCLPSDVVTGKADGKIEYD